MIGVAVLESKLIGRDKNKFSHVRLLHKNSYPTMLLPDCQIQQGGAGLAIRAEQSGMI
jgi:hypothetical protein